MNTNKKYIWDFCSCCENFNYPDCPECLRKTFRNVVIKRKPYLYSEEKKKEKK